MKRFCLLLTATVLAAPTLTAAQNLKQNPSREAQRWVATPSDEQQAQAWPARARAVGVGGRAVAKCTVGGAGALSACRVVSEFPSASGFGDALLSLTPAWRKANPVPGQQVYVFESWFGPYDRPPAWERRPTREQLMSVFPAAAAATGANGEAVIHCLVTPQGALTDCFPIHEEPEGAGFGAAAISLAPQFLMKPAIKDGKPAFGTVSVPINFKPGGAVLRSDTFSVAPASLAWSQAPTYEDVLAAYPSKAKAANVAGRATLGCDMTSDGRLRPCSVLNHSPTGYGFDDAAKSLAKHFRYDLSAQADKDAARRVKVQVPVAFDPRILASQPLPGGRPAWIATPTSDEIRSAFNTLGFSGTLRAALDCRVEHGGALSDCKIASEEPKGTGAVALQLAPKFKVSTWSAEGLPTVGTPLRVPLRYEAGTSTK